MKRPDAPIDKGKAPVSKPVPPTNPPSTRTDTQAPGTSSAPQPAKPKNVDIPPPTNPINRQDGWKRSVRFKDVEMKDDTKHEAKDKPSQSGPQYRITSDLQESVDYKTVFGRMMDKEVSVPIKELIGISPALQKILSESTRPRREYTTRQASYSAAEQCARYDEEAMDDNDHEIEVIYADGTNVESPYRGTTLVVNNQDMTNPSLQWFTGSFTVHINDVPFKVMIDTGSELNVCDNTIPKRCALPLDYVGSHWSLSGIHGDPERLEGLCSKVDFKIGSHVFPIGILSCTGSQDLSTMIARLTLRKDGEQRAMPTLSIVIVNPNDSRNQTEIHVPRPVHSAWIEEVSDEDDDSEDF
ncbi:hypothetical protein BDZ89DRAFT_1150642 [Hymenopellis radicata]|nr:hypothetical protein BDZ89DRAFT_1150642 [Hymenopellis radicata]